MCDFEVLGMILPKIPAREVMVLVRNIPHESVYLSHARKS